MVRGGAVGSLMEENVIESPAYESPHFSQDSNIHPENMNFQVLKKNKEEQSSQIMASLDPAISRLTSFLSQFWGPAEHPGDVSMMPWDTDLELAL